MRGRCLRDPATGGRQVDQKGTPHSGEQVEPLPNQESKPRQAWQARPRDLFANVGSIFLQIDENAIRTTSVQERLFRPTRHDCRLVAAQATFGLREPVFPASLLVVAIGS